MKEEIHRIDRYLVFMKFQRLVIGIIQKWIWSESVSVESFEIKLTWDDHDGNHDLDRDIKVARRRRCAESSSYRVAARWSVEHDKNTNDQSIHFGDDVTRYARCLRSHRFETHDDTKLLRDEIRKITRRNQERVQKNCEQTSVKWMMWIWHKRLHWFLQEWVTLSSCGTDCNDCPYADTRYLWCSVGRGALQHINWLQYLIENIKEIEGESLRMIDIIDAYQVQWNVFDNSRDLDEAQYDDQCSTYYLSTKRVIKDVWILRTDDFVLERVVIRGLR